MNTQPFDEAYAGLNHEQRRAVDTIEGPVMVIAGPGTGKTQILTLRIANILQKTDVGPENILALTFTESGAKAMRERLARYIGAPAYRVHIHTFHEFAGHCIREYPDAYTRAVGGRPMTDLEKITRIESILETPTLKLLRPTGNPQFYVKPIMSALSLMKREYITPDRFAEIIEAQQETLSQTPKVHEKGAHKGKVRSEYIEREKSVNKNRELLFVYRAYEAAIVERRQFDFDDMIFETVEALSQNEDMLRSLQEKYQYILADEHQDVNGSQNKILELLSSFHERPNIFVVGDEKQSIYRFQGASLENFLYFEEKFPHTVTVPLTQNYRSAQSILDLAHELITKEIGPAADLRVPLTAYRTEAAIIERRQYTHEAIEHDTLIRKIRELVAAGVPYEEIAIIVRTNREVEDIAAFVRAHDIPAHASAEGDILMHPIISHIRTLIAAVTNPVDERNLFTILHSGYLGIPTADLVTIVGSRSYTRSLTRIVEDSPFLQSLNITSIDAVLRIPTILNTARTRMNTDAPHRVLEYLLRETGFLDHAIARHPHDGARVIRRLYDEIEEMVHHDIAVTLRDVETMLKTHTEHNLPLNAPYAHTQHHAVQIMTAHKAKGLEFLHVFIPHLVDSKWGGKTRTEYFKIPVTTHLKPDDFSVEDDERKLLYVALTRAKVGLYVSASETNAEGRTQLATRLLEDTGESFITTIDTQSDEVAFNPLSALTDTQESPVLDTAFLTDMLRARGLSATALNNYLRDPWNYFYRNVVRIPEIQPESALFGTALHDTLRSVMKHRREHGDMPSITELKTYLERELGKLPVTPNEYVRNHERGFVALTNYLHCIEQGLPHETKEEHKVQVMLPTGLSHLPEIFLTGQFDRLDFDAEGNLLRVVDYKSGKPKTRGYIEGTTKDSNGDYKRQLVFYALILSLHDDEQLKTRNGLLSFIEADERGNIHEEPYTITHEEIESLKAEIIRVVAEITSGTFLTHPCDPEKCEYANLVEEFRNRAKMSK